MRPLDIARAIGNASSVLRRQALPFGTLINPGVFSVSPLKKYLSIVDTSARRDVIASNGTLAMLPRTLRCLARGSRFITQSP